MDNRRVLEFLASCLAAGKPSVLVSVAAVEGSSMRDPGTLMGVCSDGSFEGSLSGGCIENAVIAEALDALAKKQPRLTRFGSGSPYLDIRLPCGGGLDIHFQPLSDAALMEACSAATAARQPFSIELDLSALSANFSAQWQPTHFNREKGAITIGQMPAPRLLVIGHGAVVEALADLAFAMALDIEVLTPDERLVSGITENKPAIPVTRLATPNRSALLNSDPWTAIVFLFHDHDWEIELMAQALQMPNFYIGAMGGRKAHSFRGDALRHIGVKEAAIDSIHAPIGLFHSARDPATLALSTLGEIVKAYQNTDFSADGR